MASHTAIVWSVATSTGTLVVKPGLPPQGPHVRFRRVQTLVREGSPLVKLAQIAAHEAALGDVAAADYLPAMFEFSLPTRATAVPSGPDWLHEIKYDSYRLRLERDGDRRSRHGNRRSERSKDGDFNDCQYQ